MDTSLDLQPEELRDVAKAVIEASAEQEDYAQRARMLAESGLLGLLTPGGCGGLDLPISLALPVMEEAGGNLLSFALLETMLLSRALAHVDCEVASALVEGRQTATIAWSNPIAVCGGMAARAPCLAQCDWVLIQRDTGDGVLMPTHGDQVTVHDELSMDLTHTEARVEVRSFDGGLVLSAQDIADLQRDAWLLRTAMIAGSAQTCLDITCAYAQQRKQFKRPLAANQAISHKLARQCLNVASMRNSMTRSLAQDEEARTYVYAAGFAGACDLGSDVVEAAIQVHGGIGFSWDLPLHRHIRQIKTWSAQGSKAQALELVAQTVWRQAAA